MPRTTLRLSPEAAVATMQRSATDGGWSATLVHVTKGTRARLDALVARGCAVVGPLREVTEEGEVDWYGVVVLPDGEEMKGRGATDEEAAIAAASRAEGSPLL